MKIRDCEWDYLSQQRSLRAPHEPMPRLQDLLEYLAKPGSENIWILLDIKVLSIPSTSSNPLITHQDDQRRRVHNASHRTHSIPRSTLAFQTLAPASRPWYLGSKISATLHSIPPRLPNHSYRLLHLLRTPIPRSPQHILQYSPKSSHGPARSLLHPRCQSQQPAIVRMDR